MDIHSVKAFIEHPAMNQSWLAEQLWGSREGKFRTRWAKSMNGTRQWKPEEIEKLKEIRDRLVKDI